MSFSTIKQLRDLLDMLEKNWTKDDERIYGKFEDQLFDRQYDITLDYVSQFKFIVE